MNPQVAIEGMRDIDRAGVFALATPGASFDIHVAWFLKRPGDKTSAVFFDRFNFTVCVKLDVAVVGDGRHFRCGDAAAAVQRGENLAQLNHFSPNARLPLNQRYLIPLVSKIQGGLHSCDPAPHNERVHPSVFYDHDSPTPVLAKRIARQR
jgi:hypothetical protein